MSASFRCLGHLRYYAGTPGTVRLVHDTRRSRTEFMVLEKPPIFLFIKESVSFVFLAMPACSCCLFLMRVEAVVVNTACRLSR